MSDLLSIGASGVRAYQSALGTVSDNIANAGTAGYARRSTTLASVDAVGGLATSRVLAGSGVVVTGTARAFDQYKAEAVRSSGADLARSSAASTWLDRVQSAVSDNDLDTRMTAFFSAATTLSADPTATAARSSMLEAGTSVANAFSATGRALDQTAADLDGTADDAATQITQFASALAKVNDGLGRAAPGSAAAAGLADQRDSLLEQMSAISDVNVQLDALGRASVRVGGATGPTLVSGIDAGSLTYARATDGSVTFSVHRDGVTNSATPTGGALAGVADAAQRTTDARTQVNTIASNFANGINALQASGEDANGNAGAAMFATGKTPTDLTLSLTDPAGIAAAAPGGGARDASNLTKLAALRTSGGFEAGVTTLVSDVGAELKLKQNVMSAQSTIHDNAVASRDTLAGVNLDTEAVDLMRFQQAYSASSRVIQVARETFQSILQIQ